MAFAKTKNITVLSSQTLESSEAATQAAASRSIVDSYYSDQVNVSCKYTTGASETGTTCYIKLWGYIGSKNENTNFPYTSGVNLDIANDTANWIQLGEYVTTGGEAVFTATTYKIVGGAGATVYAAHFAQGLTFSKLRVSAYESGVSSNKGNLTVVVSVQ